MSDDKKKKILRMDQAVILGAGCLLGGFIMGLLSYHLIMGTPATPSLQQAQMAPPPNLAPPQAQTQDFTAQIREVKLILEKEPGNRNAWVELGNMLFDSNRHQESIDAYSKALQIDSKDANVLTDRGIMYRAIGNFQAALSDFRKASQVDSAHIQSLYNEGITLLHDLNDMPGAVKAWEQILQRNPPSDLREQMTQRIKAAKEMMEKKQ